MDDEPVVDARGLHQEIQREARRERLMADARRTGQVHVNPFDNRRVVLNEDDNPFEAEEKPIKPVDRKAKLKAKLKERHLNKEERDRNHKPESDWCESARGDVCKSSFTLEIKDILAKHKV